MIDCCIDCCIVIEYYDSDCYMVLWCYSSDGGLSDCSDRVMSCYGCDCNYLSYKDWIL